MGVCMEKYRTNEEAMRDLLARDEMVAALQKSHGLGEYYAEGVYYKEYTIEEALIIQEKERKRRMAEMDEPLHFITSIEEFERVLKEIDCLVALETCDAQALIDLFELDVETFYRLRRWLCECEEKNEYVNYDKIEQWLKWDREKQ